MKPTERKRLEEDLRAHFRQERASAERLFGNAVGCAKTHAVGWSSNRAVGELAGDRPDERSDAQSDRSFAERAYESSGGRLAARAEGHAEFVAALAAAAASGAAASNAGFDGVVRAAVVSTPRAFWAAPAAVVVLALSLSFFGVSEQGMEAALVASGPVLVAACLAGVVRAKSCLMQELEASCLHNAVAVACARFAVLGGAAFLALAIACLACSAIVPAGAAAAYALAPCLVAAAGGLLLARRVSSADATVAAVAWSAGVCALCLLLRFSAPGAYEAAAVWAWAAVAAAGALWCAREVCAWLRLCAQGGISPASPVRGGAW